MLASLEDEMDPGARASAAVPPLRVRPRTRWGSISAGTTSLVLLYSKGGALAFRTSVPSSDLWFVLAFHSQVVSAGLARQERVWTARMMAVLYLICAPSGPQRGAPCTLLGI